MLQDTLRFKMDLVTGLERTLHGQVKPSKPLSLSLYIYIYIVSIT